MTNLRTVVCVYYRQEYGTVQIEGFGEATVKLPYGPNIKVTVERAELTFSEKLERALKVWRKPVSGGNYESHLAEVVTKTDLHGSDS